LDELITSQGPRQQQKNNNERTKKKRMRKQELRWQKKNVKLGQYFDFLGSISV
jgi:hypothetical protein